MKRLITTALLLFSSSILTTSQEVRHAAVSSNTTFCFGQCEQNHRNRLSYDSRLSNESKLIFHLPCYSVPQIPVKFSGRETFNVTTGCVTLSNLTKSDAGRYQRERIDAGGKIETLPEIEVKVLDKVWIRELSRNDSDGNISLTVVCTGELYTIIWTMDGRQLPDRHWLSDNNRTLTVPYNVTGTFMVNASNPVNAESKNITIIRDLLGNSSYLGPVMYRNISRVIWGEGGGQAGNRTLILLRNVTNLYVMSVSETPDKPPIRYFWLLLLILLLFFLIPACVLWKNRRRQMDRGPKGQNGRPGCSVKYQANGPAEECVSLARSREQENIPVTNGDLPHNGIAGNDEATVDHVHHV